MRERPIVVTDLDARRLRALLDRRGETSSVDQVHLIKTRRFALPSEQFAQPARVQFCYHDGTLSHRRISCF